MSAVQSQLATIPQRVGLVQKFAAKYSIEPDKLMGILKSTAFKVKDGEATNEQMAALLVVADQYGLNPFTKEIFAFPDAKNGIVPVVGVDGWSRIINDHPESDGFEFRHSEEMVTLPDAQECPKWMEVVIHRKDRSHPIVVREYLDEVYRKLGTYPDGNKHKPGPWQTHTKRFLRHKTLIQGARIAYGFGGIYDEDEAERIIDMGAAQVVSDKPAIAMPQSKSAAATPAATGTVIDNETGEIVGKESAPAASAPANPPPASSGGAAPDTKPLSPGQSRLLKAKLSGAALTEIDFEAQYPQWSLEPKAGRELVPMGEVNNVLAWVEASKKG